MTIKTFTEEEFLLYMTNLGYTEAQAKECWKARPSDTLNFEALEEAAKATLSLAKALRTH